MDRVPILKIGDVLLVSIQVDMHDQMAMQLQTDLGERIVETGCHGVIIDITGLDIVDSFVGRTLSTIASISRVLDAETIVVGMRPAVAITLVELGLSLNGIRTALNVERGLQLLSAATHESEPVEPLEDDGDAFPGTPYAVERRAYAENGREKPQLR
jgi:rsbT antagonist protein RsbS